MGKIKYIGEVRNFFRKTPVVSARDVITFVRDKGYAYLLISNMLKKGEIKKIKKGFYTIHDDVSLSVFCFKPAYIGLQDALSIHDLWEQETAVVIVTSRKAKHRTIKVFENNIILHRIKPKYLFGFEMIKHGDFYLPVSDLEKTFIDLIYFNKSIDKKIIREIKKRIDAKKLKEYLKKYPKKIQERVLKHL